MDLLEREPVLQALDTALRDVAAGHGRVVLISGEADDARASVRADEPRDGDPRGPRRRAQQRADRSKAKLDVTTRQDAARVSRAWRAAGQSGEVAGTK